MSQASIDGLSFNIVIPQLCRLLIETYILILYLKGEKDEKEFNQNTSYLSSYL